MTIALASLVIATAVLGAWTLAVLKVKRQLEVAYPSSAWSLSELNSAGSSALILTLPTAFVRTSKINENDNFTSDNDRSIGTCFRTIQRTTQQDAQPPLVRNGCQMTALKSEFSRWTNCSSG